MRLRRCLQGGLTKTTQQVCCEDELVGAAMERERRKRVRDETETTKSGTLVRVSAHKRSERIKTRTATRVNARVATGRAADTQVGNCNYFSWVVTHSHDLPLQERKREMLQRDQCPMV